MIATLGWIYPSGVSGPVLKMTVLVTSMTAQGHQKQHPQRQDRSVRCDGRTGTLGHGHAGSRSSLCLGARFLEQVGPLLEIANARQGDRLAAFAVPRGGAPVKGYRYRRPKHPQGDATTDPDAGDGSDPITGALPGLARVAPSAKVRRL